MFSSLLRELRANRGITQAALGARLGISRGYIAQLERGDKPPQAEIVRRLRDEFPAAFDAVVAELARKQPDASTTLRLWTGTEDIVGAADPMLLPGLSMIAVRQAMRFQPPDPARLEERVERLVHAYPSTPVDEIFGHLILLQDSAFRLDPWSLSDADLRESVFATHAKVQVLLGKVSHDLGDPQAALVHLHVAADALRGAPTMSGSTEDGMRAELRAWIYNLESLVQYWNGDASRAWTSACLAARVAQDGPMASWAAASKVRAAARIPDLPLVRELTQTLEARTGDDEVEEAQRGLIGFPDEKQLYYIAEAFALAAHDRADVSEAVERATAAVAAYGGLQEVDSYSDWAGAQAALALALVKAGDIQGAEDSIDKVLVSLDRPRRIRGIRASLRRVYQAVQSRDTLEEDLMTSSELRNRIEDFVAGGLEIATDPVTRVARKIQSSSVDPVAKMLGDFVDDCIGAEPSIRRHGLKLAERLEATKKSVETAREYYRRACAGDGDATYKIAKLLDDRPKPDPDEAAWWYERAAESGHVEAMYSLGILLADRLVPRDLEGATPWLKRAAEAGHPGAASMFRPQPATTTVSPMARRYPKRPVPQQTRGQD
ncbi:helix-turn-helix domain-containing protein [Microlunatus ginsengisoli]|uniref:HTH cro/C1-type domain-containing protein n=1 Tax=Microlunatus ginsengisoli TaxID=363863 RepID=A0ABP6ZP93_9ACTN